ncbi:hypothetical protein ASG76_04240 [Nocardioides sp. Soil774]|uniref:DUF6454 family protein n=1 Tax=Nocardioides sp. Soil774 TaxID=1736408 RepID=UPI0006F32C39|nr:DUF6454 family protein [Nocardioides sp. Soil774]KRE96249.1 hypothetical protein ASG76_04240 [Nocardioides sp. Soil774]
MTRRLTSLSCAAVLVLGLSAAASARTGAPTADDDPLVDTFENVSRSTTWTKTGTVRLDFNTHHPQAMEVVGDRIYLSSVEIIEAPVKYPQPVDGYDRSPGKGVGHLFVLEKDGTLIKDIVLGEGDIYHPGGLDVDQDGNIWLPVAEYRPNSEAIIYKVDPNTFEAQKMFTVADHIGGVVRDQESGRLVGQSWGSRRFYEWTTSGRQKSRWLNDSHFIDYQDCEYVASRKTLCSGIAALPAQPGATTPYELGGFALLDLRTRRIIHEVPTQLWSTAGHVVTRNPTDIDVVGDHLTMYAAPDDFGEGNNTEILTYEAVVTPLS